MRLNFIYFSAFFYACTGIFNLTAFSQAEQPEMYRNYIMINENAKKIKDSKIKTVYEVYSEKGKADTLRFAEYDAAGNITREIVKTDSTVAPGKLKNNSYVYKEGRLIERIDSSADVKRYFISYDEFGGIVKEDVKVQGKLSFETEYEYDNLGRLTESSTKDLINKCKVIIAYAYDSYNNLAKESIKDECKGTKDKPVNVVYNYKYDNKSRIIEKQSIYPNAGYKIMNYQYGPNGELISSYESQGSDTYDNTKFTYDEKTNTIKVEKSEVMGDLTKTITGTIQNDKFGNRIEEKYFDSNGNLLYSIKNIYQYY